MMTRESAGACLVVACTTATDCARTPRSPTQSSSPPPPATSGKPSPSPASSPALDVTVRLSAVGAVVSVYDPAAMDTARREHPELRYAGSPAEAAAGAEVLMHLTAWLQLTQIDPHELEPADPPLLVDARPGPNRPRWRKAGWTVSAL